MQLKGVIFNCLKSLLSFYLATSIVCLNMIYFLAITNNRLLHNDTGHGMCNMASMRLSARVLTWRAGHIYKKKTCLGNESNNHVRYTYQTTELHFEPSKGRQERHHQRNINIILMTLFSLLWSHSIMDEHVDLLEERKPAALTSNDHRIQHLLSSGNIVCVNKELWIDVSDQAPLGGYNKCDKDTLDVLAFHYYFFPFCLRLRLPIIINVWIGTDSSPMIVNEISDAVS